MGRQPFRSSYLDWLALVWERLEELDCPDTGSDGPIQSSGFMLELLRIRRECQLMERTAHIQHSMGRVDATLQTRLRTLLHDLHWLLQVSPSASPALARQCVRIAQDRVSDEVQELARSAAVESAPPHVAAL
jgi:ABC-type phosphonate transport system ATPase subunit